MQYDAIHIYYNYVYILIVISYTYTIIAASSLGDRLHLLYLSLTATQLHLTPPGPRGIRQSTVSTQAGGPCRRYIL